MTSVHTIFFNGELFTFAKVKVESEQTKEKKTKYIQLTSSCIASVTIPCGNFPSGILGENII